ncbi:MAG: C39 family peptidase [Methanobrevibacter sp.]|nr:C39 family peptidase [Methanobrevibacter sp.]
MKTINEVAYISQTPAWPTGCECVSTVMLLNYLHCPITVDEFITYIPKKPLCMQNNKLYGESPDEYFIGTPYDHNSYGCYSGVIVKAVNDYADDTHIELMAKDISNLSTEEMVCKYIKKKMPVLYWATIDLKPSRPGTVWQLNEREAFQWIANEHCMLLVGENDKTYVFNDPWNNNGVVEYPKELVKRRHDEMLSMAVAIEYSS